MMILIEYGHNYKLLARSYLEAAKYYMGTGDYDNAENLLKKCAEIEPPMKINKKNIFYDYKEEASEILSNARD